MSEKLLITLQRASRRLRLQKTVRLIVPALSIGLLATLSLTLLGRLYPLAPPHVLLVGGLGVTLVSLGTTLAYGWLRAKSPLAMARLLDHHFNLDERLSTSLELTTGRNYNDNTYHNTSPHIIRAQQADTLRHLEQLDPSRAFPIRVPRLWLTLATVLAIAIAANMIIPNPQVQVFQQRAKAEEIIARQQARFEKIRTDLLEDQALLEQPPGQELRQTLDELVEKLQQENTSLEEAMAAISEAEQDLAPLENAAIQRENALNELAQTFKQFNATAELARALDQRNLTRAAEAMAARGQDLPTTSEARRELAEAFRQAARAVTETGDTELAKALDLAAEAMAGTLKQDPGQDEFRSGEPGSAPGERPGARQQAGPETAEQQAAQQALQQAAEALAEAGRQLAGREAVEDTLANIQTARQQLAAANNLTAANDLAAPEGQSGAGQGQDTGPGLAEAAGPTAGQAPGGAGSEDPGPGAGGLFSREGASGSISTDNTPIRARSQEYVPLYIPDHLGGRGGPILNPEPQGAAEGIPIGSNTPVDPDQDPGAGFVPYNQVYGQYAATAGQALDDTYIPLGMKGYIRQYFGALEPGE